MNQQEIIGKLNYFKGFVQEKFDEMKHAFGEDRQGRKSYQMSHDQEVLDADANLIEDLPLTLTRDSSPGVRSSVIEEDDEGHVQVTSVEEYVTDLKTSPFNNNVEFYDTENSQLARGARKTAHPKGLDSFGEKDTFEFDEVDDFQTDRDRKQNSDLAQRFPTHGLDLDEFNRQQ
jgi:hypothetical protein